MRSSPFPVIRRRPGVLAAAATITVASIVTGATPMPAQAKPLDPSRTLCFDVGSNPGDAAIVNLTPVNSSRAGYGRLVSSNAAGEAPTTANVNFAPGSIDPNVAVSPVGSDGRVCFQNSTHSFVDLVADHLGTIRGADYTSATSSGASDRKVDTRIGLGGPRLAPSGSLCFAVAGNPGDAAIVNLTPVAATAPGFGRLVSSDVVGGPRSTANVNFVPGSVDPNVAVASIGSDGKVCYVNSTHGFTELVVDHLGTLDSSAYTPAAPTGDPIRKVDTRIGQGGPRLVASGVLCFGVSGRPGDAAIVNLTPVAPAAPGFGRLVSSSQAGDAAVTANVNFRPGVIDPNVAVAEIGPDGRVCFQNSQHGSVDVVADHLGTIRGSSYQPAASSGKPVRRVDSRIDLGTQEPRVVRPQCEMPTTTRYDADTAKTMFGLASRAYAVEPGVTPPGELLHTAGGATSHFPEKMECWVLVAALRGGHSLLGAVTDTEVFVARNVDTDDLVVSFRGTELNLIDIITDASAVRLPWISPSGTLYSQAVHSGFYGAYEAVRAQLVSVLAREQSASGDGTRVYFTGHSLGGALATISSLDLNDELRSYGYQSNEIITYTYGAPRSISEQISNYHRSVAPVSFAVVNPNDPVPHVPSAIGSSNPYSHIRQMTVLHARDNSRTVRRNFGDGRDYGGCITLLPDFGDHIRTQYYFRVDANRFYGPPTIQAEAALAIGFRDLRIIWNSPLEGPCDRVAAWNRSSTPTSMSGSVTSLYVKADTFTQGQHTFLTTNYKDANWIGYVDMFGKVIVARKYR